MSALSHWYRPKTKIPQAATAIPAKIAKNTPSAPIILSKISSFSSSRVAETQNTFDWQHINHQWQERAAIMQFDGGLAKADAEWQAMNEFFERLCSERGLVMATEEAGQLLQELMQAAGWIGEEQLQ
jgi:hypothetical protein